MQRLERLEMRSNKLKITVIILAAGLVFLTSGLILAAGGNAAEKDSKAVAGSISEFAFNLYGRIKDLPAVQQSGGNLFFSPYSISTALAMTYTGARGNTASQMTSVLRLPTVKAETMPIEQIAAAYGALQKSLQADPEKSGYQLNVANALWGQKGYGFLPAFLDLNKKYYGSGLTELDFAQSEAARKIIDTWIEQQTKEKIKDLIPSGVLNSMTRLVLTNAIYFKGDWAIQFKKESTKPADFHVTKEKTVQVQMMYQKGSFSYGENNEMQLLFMPYKGSELSMLIILPKTIDSFDSVEQKVIKNSLPKAAVMRRPEVEVYLPKFKITCGTLELGDILKEMGMKDAFSLPPADFSGMDGKMDLFISNVMHKAFVEVNEEGTEAAAATGVGISITSVLTTRAPIFRADHPFIFFINDNRTSCILFMGRLMNPAVQE
jgi:serpin B